MRKKIVAGNWKMNKTLEEANILASEVKAMVEDEVKGKYYCYSMHSIFVSPSN